MDFVSDALFDGRRIRALTVVDNFTRESLAIEVGQGVTGEQVVAVMNRIAAVRGAPKSIRIDNGPEFVSRALDQCVSWSEPRKLDSPQAEDWTRV